VAHRPSFTQTRDLTGRRVEKRDGLFDYAVGDFEVVKSNSENPILVVK